MNPEGMVALLDYRVRVSPDLTVKYRCSLLLTRRMASRVSISCLSMSVLESDRLYTAYFTFWKDGVKEIKL